MNNSAASTSHAHRPHPASRRHLEGSKWSRTNAVCELRHFEVRRVDAQGTVELFSVLRPEVVERVDWRSLRDREKWLPGWVYSTNETEGFSQPGDGEADVALEGTPVETRMDAPDSTERRAFEATSQTPLTTPLPTQQPAR